MKNKCGNKSNKNNQLISIALIIAAIIMVIITIVVCANSGDNIPPQDNKKSAAVSDSKSKKTKESDSVSTFKMSMAGDYIIYSTIWKGANEAAGGEGYDFSGMVSNLKNYTKDCDVNYYNQETILGGTEMGLSDYPLFISPQEAGDAMVDLGYNLVSTATNHSLDGGEEGILKSYDYWSKQNGVFMAGTYDSQEHHDEARILECNNIKYTMLNYTYDTNGIPVPEGKEYLINVWPTDLTINDPANDTKYQEYKKQVKKDIDAVRDKVDFLIVAMHAGVEYMPDESEYQDDMAQFLADNGVNLIIGTHPHVIEPAEYIGDTLCYYSMGNLLCSQYQDENYNKVTSILATMTVKKTVKNGETKITFEDLNNELLYCYYDQNTWRGHKVIPFSSSEIKDYMPEYKDVYNTYKDIFTKKDKRITLTPCAK